MSLPAGPPPCFICGKLGVSFLHTSSSESECTGTGGMKPSSVACSKSILSTGPCRGSDCTINVDDEDVFQKWARACSSSMCELFGLKDRTDTDALKLVFERSPYCKLCIQMVRDVNWIQREIELLTMRRSALKARLINKLSESWRNSEVVSATDALKGLALGKEEETIKIWKILEQRLAMLANSNLVGDDKRGHDEQPSKSRPGAVCNLKIDNGLGRKVLSVGSVLDALPNIWESKDDLGVGLNSYPKVVKVGGNDRRRQISIKCTEITCKRKFLSQETMKIHVRKVHEDCELPFDCTLCSRSFATKGAYGIHMMRHQAPSFICELCGRQFTVKRVLRDHNLRMHSSRPAYSCKTCSLALTSREMLEKHESQHVSEKGFPFICVVCQKNHSNSTDLQMHVTETHISNVLRCEQCGKTFWAMESLRKHLSTHKDRNPKFSCSECGYVAASQSKLKDHMGKHSVEKHLVCQVCGSSFKYKKSLSRHMRCHSNETPYKCAVCGKGFRDMQKKKRHEEIHSGNKYPCQFCKKEFNAQQNLQQHLRVVHTPKNPLKIKKPRGLKKKISSEHLVPLPPPKPKTAKQRVNEHPTVQIEEIPKTSVKNSKVSKNGKPLKRKSSTKKGQPVSNKLPLTELGSKVKLEEEDPLPTANLSYIDSVPLQEVEVTYQDASSFEFINETANPNVTNTIKFETYAPVPVQHDETLNYHHGVHHIAVLQHENANSIAVPISVSEMQGLQIVNAVVTDNNYYF
ncbi:unnamed protein product [Orchesella dallaii]|uniref:C2H2-type domain-containing protein n=1 Tax=Orchesella dallaii TaxID=48710 RepID=A0ABP1PQV6_9HEXA